MKRRVVLISVLILGVPLACAQKKTTQSGAAKSSAQKQAAGASKLEATGHQRELYDAAYDSLGQVAEEARALVKMTETSAFDVREARRQRDALRKQISAMLAGDTRFRISLNMDQKHRLQSPLTSVAVDRDRVNMHLRELNVEMGRREPARTGVRQHAGGIRDSALALQGHYRGMKSPLGLR